LEKKLAEITRNDWIRYDWVELSYSSGDSNDRTFLRGSEHTPNEAAQAMEDWDSTAEERGKIETENKE